MTSSSARRKLPARLAAIGIFLLMLAVLGVPSQRWKTSAQSGESRKPMPASASRRNVNVAERKPRVFRGSPESQSTAPSPLDVDVAPPNDNCSGAIALSVGQSVNGTLADALNDYQLSGAACFTGIGQFANTAPGRDVVYSFTAPVTTTYSFRVTNFEGNYDYMIYTASTCPAGAPPVTVASCLNASDRNANAGPSEEVFCQAMTAGQTVFIFVDEFTADTVTDQFKIEVTQCVRETEANNTPATANSFIFGMEGTINPGADADFFSLGTTVPGSRIFSLVDGSAGVDQQTEDFDLRVTTATTTLEYDDDNADLSFGFFSAAVGGTTVTGTSTFLRISDFGATPNEPYRLYAITKPPGANPIAACVTQTTSAIDETEPNDTLVQANTNPLGYFEGTLSTATDLDIFSFTANAGDLIFASLDLDPCRNNTPFDGDMFLLDASLNTLVVAQDGSTTSNTTPGASLTSTTPFSPAEGLVYRIQTPGTYYIGLQVFAGTGDYLLAISKNGNPIPSAANGVVSGRVLDGSGTPVEGAVVRLNGGGARKTITDAKGRYHFDNVETNGFYTVTPSRANFNFNPFNRSFSMLGNHTDAEFTASFTGDGVNPLDTPEYFVRQQYVDLLGREPDEGGFNYWSDEILRCGGEAACVNARRNDIAAAFFIEQEFQQTGSYIYNLYKSSLGRQPGYSEYAVDRKQVVGGPNLETEKTAFAENFVKRAEFLQKYQTNTSGQSFVDALLATVWNSSNLDLGAQRGVLRALYDTGNDMNQSRMLVVRQLIENPNFRGVEYNPAFVLTEYFSYLRRNPEREGYDFWLNVLDNREAENFRGMVCSFTTSTEYQRRFSSVVSHNNGECGR
jgi:hypothetical protein